MCNLMELCSSYVRPELTVAPGDTVVPNTWATNPESDITGYYIYRDGVRLNNSLLIESTFKDGGLTNGKAYKYAVTAVDGNGS